MTGDSPRDEVGAIPARPSARVRSGDGNGLVGARSASVPAANWSLILRSTTPPVDQLDYDDRHDTRATESDELARRYSELRKERRRDDWHKLAMGLIGFAVLAVLYVAGFIVVSRLLPHVDPWLAAKIVGLAFVASGGGAAVRSAGQVLRRRAARPRGRGISQHDPND